ncbi:vacuole effluxer Atg22 like-domain-containing protein, partial [Peziza echinospora]
MPDRDPYYFEHHHHHNTGLSHSHNINTNIDTNTPTRPSLSPRRTSSYRLILPPPPPPPEITLALLSGTSEPILRGPEDLAADADDERSFSEMDDDDVADGIHHMNGHRVDHHHNHHHDNNNPSDADDELAQTDTNTNPASSSYHHHHHSYDDDDEIPTSYTPSTSLHNLPTTTPFLSRRKRPKKLFPAQDTRPTDLKELAGWYSYAWAAEAFAVCGIGSFVPLALEGLARENGVVRGSGGRPCSGSGVGGGSGPPGDGGGSGGGVEQCVVYILGWGVNTASFAMYTFSISVFIQALVIISMSGAADHGKNRKRLLLLFAFMGSIATILFITVTPALYIFSALWAIIGNVGFGASFVLLNAFLPVLVRNHPSLLNLGNIRTSNTASSHHALNGHTRRISNHNNGSNNNSNKGSNKNPAKNNSNKNNNDDPALILSSQISSYGMAIGYCGAVLMQMFGIMLVIMTGSSVWSLQLVLACIGGWWFAFTVPAALWLRPRPGPPLPREGGGGGVGGHPGLWEYVTFSWRGLWKTVKRAGRLRDVMMFLAAWFMISDGVATVSGTAILFAKNNLHMKPAEVALISVISTLFGVVGAFGWARMSQYFAISPSQTILILILVFELIPLYGLLGFLPIIQRSGIGGLTHPHEMYALGALYGLVLGGIGSYCRSVFSELVPPGSEAAFFALYAITDKGSSVVGPVVVGILTDRYGDIRAGFWFLAVLLVLPVPLIWGVDVGRGKREAGRVARE